MDTFSTVIGGALIGRALPEDARGPSAVSAVALAALLPDGDVFFDNFVGGPLASLTLHRGITHSLVGVAVMAPLLALLLRRFSKDKSYRRLLGLVTLGFAWHLFTDLATSWGTMVYSPFSRERVVWDLIFIIDFVFTGILLLPHLLAWVYRPRGDALSPSVPARGLLSAFTGIAATLVSPFSRTALRRGVLVWAALTAFTAAVIKLASPFFGLGFNWALFALLSALLAGLFAAPAVRGGGFRQSPSVFCQLGVAALALYLGVCTTAHWVALGRVKQFTEVRGLRVEAQAAIPQPLSPFRWSGLVLTPQGVYQSWFNVLESHSPQFEFFPNDAGNEYVRKAESLPEVETYLWFARFPVARYRNEGGQHIVEYTDRRFNSFRSRTTAFVYRVVFDNNKEVVSSGFVSR